MTVTLTKPIGPTETEIRCSGSLTAGQYVRIEDELLLVGGYIVRDMRDYRPKLRWKVERGQYLTDAADHDAGAVIQLANTLFAVQAEAAPAPFLDLTGGVAGPKGDTGDAGPAGAQGEPGPQGDPGADGATGSQGPQGLTGDTGPQGPQGDTGAQGPKGDTGDAGAPGSQGPKGDAGDTGATGPQGDPGPQGSQGIQGPAGTNGTNWTPVHTLLADGTTAMALGTNTSVKVTPTASATFTTTVPAAGRTVRIIILTSGTTSRTITFGSGFKATGTLATGTTSGRVFVVSFISDGTNLYEMGRTIAMVA